MKWPEKLKPKPSDDDWKAYRFAAYACIPLVGYVALLGVWGRRAYLWQVPIWIFVGIGHWRQSVKERRKVMERKLPPLLDPSKTDGVLEATDPKV